MVRTRIPNETAFVSKPSWFVLRPRLSSSTAATTTGCWRTQSWMAASSMRAVERELYWMREESPRHSGLPQTAQDVLTWSERNRCFELTDKSICLGEGPKRRGGSGAAEERVGEEDLETEWIFRVCRRGICLRTVAGRWSREESDLGVQRLVRE